MARRLKIAVLRDRYPTLFNTPRVTRHEIKRVPFIPTHKISRHIESFTQPLTFGADLGHYVNRIPLFSDTPYIMTFESHLPRYFGGEQTRLFQFMRQKLASLHCRRIIAMSNFAKNIFINQHKNTPEFETLKNKLEVVYPNIHLPECRLGTKTPALPLKIIFIGAHFGRKGGAVAARAAEIARTKKLPVHFQIVSSLVAGKGVWTDPQQDGFFEPYFKLLNGHNITFDRYMANKNVLLALKHSDFSLLTTFGDTFGYSAIESLAVGTPVIATPQCALPEFIKHEENGLILPLDTDAAGEWKYIGASNKGSEAFAALFRAEVERLANELIAAIEPYCAAPEKLLSLRVNARRTAETLFDTQKTSVYLDDLYQKCVSN